MSLIAKNRKIEISNDVLRVKSRNGTTEEEIDLGEVNRIIVKSVYSKQDDKSKDIYKELKKDFQKNFLIVEVEERQARFEFLLDSHYMIVQINKLITYWKSIGYKVETLEKLPMVRSYRSAFSY